MDGTGVDDEGLPELIRAGYPGIVAAVARAGRSRRDGKSTYLDLHHLVAAEDGITHLADHLEVQIEVKGYRTDDLADVHLQASQVACARGAAGGNPPPWFLHALRKAHAKSPERRTVTAAEAVALLDVGT